MNLGVLYRSEKKQVDYQELPNSSLTHATCPNPAHPENNVQGTQNLSVCQKGSIHHCLYTWNVHILHVELKTTLCGPIFAASFVSRMHICNHSALLRQKGLSRLLVGAVNFFQESQIFSFSNYLLAKSVPCL